MIKCEWLNCKFNSGDKEDHYPGASGYCKCKDEIYLESDEECEKCNRDRLCCKNYVGKEYGEN